MMIIAHTYSMETFVVDMVNKIFSDKFDKKILKRILKLIKDFNYLDLEIQKQGEKPGDLLAWDKKAEIAKLIIKAKDIIKPYFKNTLNQANLGKWTSKGHKRFKEFIASEDLPLIDMVIWAYLVVAFALQYKKNIRPDVAVIDINECCNDVPFLNLCFAPSKKELAKGNFEIRGIYLPMKWLTADKYSVEIVKNRVHEYESGIKSRNFSEKIYKKCKMRLI